MYIYIYIHTFIHIHTHTYMRTSICLPQGANDVKIGVASDKLVQRLA